MVPGFVRRRPLVSTLALICCVLAGFVALSLIAYRSGAGWSQPSPGPQPRAVTDTSPLAAPTCTPDLIEISGIQMSRPYGYGHLTGEMRSHCLVSAIIRLRWTIHNQDGSTTVHEFYPTFDVVQPNSKYPFETYQILAPDATAYPDVVAQVIQ